MVTERKRRDLRERVEGDEGREAGVGVEGAEEQHAGGRDRGGGEDKDDVGWSQDAHVTPHRHAPEHYAQRQGSASSFREVTGQGGMVVPCTVSLAL